MLTLTRALNIYQGRSIKSETLFNHIYMNVFPQGNLFNFFSKRSSPVVPWKRKTSYQFFVFFSLADFSGKARQSEFLPSLHSLVLSNQKVTASTLCLNRIFLLKAAKGLVNIKAATRAVLLQERGLKRRASTCLTSYNGYQPDSSSQPRVAAEGKITLLYHGRLHMIKC